MKRSPGRNPLLTADQLAPAFVVLKTPLGVPAYITPDLLGSNARSFTDDVIPLPAAVHPASRPGLEKIGPAGWDSTIDRVSGKSVDSVEP